jgi:predicted dienelactone hydrolase
MDSFDSSPNPSQSLPKKATLKYLKSLSLQLFRRTKGLLEAQKLPYVAKKTCEIYLGDADAARRAKCRRILGTRMELNPAQLYRFFHTSLGKMLLVWFERFFHLPGAPNKKHVLKDLLLQMASDPEGLSLLSVLRRSPNTIQVNIDQLLFTAKRVELLLQAADATIETIRELAIAEAHAVSGDFSGLPNLHLPGSFAIQQYDLMLEQRSPDHAPGTRISQPLQVVCYAPDPLPEGQIPVVIQSHGLASCPEDLEAYAQHLASYGYFVAAPRHCGSDIEQVRNMLEGNASEVFKLTEFIDRPRDISALLDELERRNEAEFAGRLNLKAVGVMGFSFGAYTAFALAGADIHFEKLERVCNPPAEDPNISLLLQCQLLELPRRFYTLHDDRIQAILVLDSLGSEVFGSEGIEKIQIPVLLIAGSQDLAAPLALEQVRIFQWLTSAQHYLALMKGKTHVQDVQRLMKNLNLQIKLSPHRTTKAETVNFENYIKSLSLIFFNQYFKVPSPSIPPLSAAYAASISHAPYDLWLLSQISSQPLREKLQVLETSLIAEAIDPSVNSQSLTANR